MKFAGVFLALPLAFFGWMYWSNARVESELQPVASAIAGHSIQVDCQGWLSSLVDVQAREGEVQFSANGLPERRIFLTRPTCKRLDAFAHSHLLEIQVKQLAILTAAALVALDTEVH